MKTWKEILDPILTSPEMTELKAWLKKERETKVIFPAPKETFRAFDMCAYRNTKVVMFGTEPYTEPGVADGLAFSTKGSSKPEPLLNIFKAAYKDMNIQYFHEDSFDDYFPSGNLEGWAENGFLLLNTILTSEQDNPLEHDGIGWEKVLDGVIDALNGHSTRLIFLLWGPRMEKLEAKIDSDRHIILSGPSPSTKEFQECKHFSVIRDILPTLTGSHRTGPMLNSCFDKIKAAEIIRREYPEDADSLIKYMQKEMMIHIQVNKSEYNKELLKFEKLMSTKTRL